jgi:aminomethyltransferase
MLALIQKVTLMMPQHKQALCLPNDQGGIVDDLLIYKLKEEAYLLVVNASNIDKDWDFHLIMT